MANTGEQSTSAVDGMTVMGYLSQGSVWIDTKNRTAHDIAGLATPKRQYAARQLVRNATGLILAAEASAAAAGDLMGALALMDEDPRSWVVDTALYHALYRADRSASGVNEVRTPSGTPVHVPVQATERIRTAMSVVERATVPASRTGN